MTYDQSPAQYAEQAAEAVRALNHITLWPGGGYEWPSDVDRVIADLFLTATRMQQALDQARHWLDVKAGDGSIGHDQGADPVAVVGDAHAGLGRAAATAWQLAADLDAVRQITAHLTGIA